MDSLNMESLNEESAGHDVAMYEDGLDVAEACSVFRSSSLGYAALEFQTRGTATCQGTVRYLPRHDKMWSRVVFSLRPVLAVVCVEKAFETGPLLGKAR